MDLGARQEAVVAPVPVSLSRVAQVAVEPGSTVKPLMGLGMLDSGLSLPFATFVCGPGGGKPHCHHCGAVDLVAAIARSCNRYFAYSLRDSSHWPIYRRSVAAFLADVGFGHAPSGEILEWSSGVWLQDGWDFPVAEALAAARRRLAASLGARAPVLDLRVMPGAPDTLGGDPERLGAGLAEVAGWMAARSGAGRLALVVAREETVGSRVDVRFEMRAAERAPWFRLPGLSDDAGLPPVLRGRAPDRGGVNGAVERGGSVWFVARFDRDLGRAGPQAAPAIRPDDGRNVAIGQGPVLVTPLHMARAMAVLANGGRLVEPHVVRTIGGVRTAHETRALDVDPRHLARIRQGMYEVVNDPAGTADRCAWHLVPGTVYGKTGTAQVGGTWRPWGLTEDGGPWHHWFVGFAEAPGRRTVAFACVLHARDEAAGGLTAAPACREILTRFYASVASRRPTEPPCDR
jgi:cell division protein FtsI/penicillin-binding protein 2